MLLNEDKIDPAANVTFRHEFCAFWHICDNL